MFEKLAKWYLSKLLRDANINDLEMVIRSDGYTYYERDKNKEALMKDFIKIIE